MEHLGDELPPNHIWFAVESSVPVADFRWQRNNIGSCPILGKLRPFYQSVSFDGEDQLKLRDFLSGETPTNASAAWLPDSDFEWLWWWVFRPHISIYIYIPLHGTSWDIMGHLCKPSNWLGKHPHFWRVSQNTMWTPRGWPLMDVSPWSTVPRLCVCLKTYRPGTESTYLRSWFLKSIHLSIYIYIYIYI